VFGLLPARAAANIDVLDALKVASYGNSDASSRRLRQALIVGELALSIVLAASALVVARSAWALNALPRGVTVDRVMTAQVALNDPQYADRTRMARVTNAIVERLRSSPGIRGAATVNYLPLALIRVGVRVDIEGFTPPAGQPAVARYFVADPEYLRIAGIPLMAGRNFTAADDMNAASVAMVSETFARRFWNGDALGRHLRTEFANSNAFWIPRAKGGPLTVVGVVRDVREDGLPDSEGFPQLYLPAAQNPTVVVTLMAKTSAVPAGAAATTIREAVRAIDPQLPVSYEMSFDDVIRETFARPREVAWLVGAFAILAFVLAAVGVYGVMAYATTARAKEIAIRVALGASRRDIVKLIVGQAMAMTAIGVVIGAAVTPLSLQLAGGMLFGVGTFDLWSLGVVAFALAVVSGCAAAIPAYRAACAGEIVARSA
jgi:putative ABC transport system permease protein